MFLTKTIKFNAEGCQGFKVKCSILDLSYGEIANMPELLKNAGDRYS